MKKLLTILVLFCLIPWVCGCKKGEQSKGEQIPTLGSPAPQPPVPVVAPLPQMGTTASPAEAVGGSTASPEAGSTLKPAPLSGATQAPSGR